MNPLRISLISGLIDIELETWQSSILFRVEHSLQGQRLRCMGATAGPVHRNWHVPSASAPVRPDSARRSKAQVSAGAARQ